jgi:hypothetical protein
METASATDWALVFVRFAHYAFAFLWMAMGFFSAFVMGFALPTLEPEARGKAMAALIPRIMPFAAIGALLTLASGYWMLAHIYLGETGIGFNHARGAWVISGVTGGTLMFLLAMVVAMPISIKMAKAQRGEIQANVPALAARLTFITRAVAFLAFPTMMSMLLASGHGGVEFSAGALCAVLASGAAVFGLLMFVATRKKG